MITPFTELLTEERKRGGAVGAFTCYDFETARAVLDAAHSATRPAILLISKNIFSAPGGEELVAGIRALANQVPTPTCLQLDHVGDIKLIAHAFANGFDAVMVDGANLPLEAHITLAAEASVLAQRSGGSTEVELGQIAGDEDYSAGAQTGALTNPDEVERFVSLTAPACLAVSIGNVHGEYAFPPTLDWSRLEAIRAKANVPLSLHGASGLLDGDVRRAVLAGITKVNINTDIRRAYLQATELAFPQVRDGWNVRALHDRQVEAVSRAVGAKLRELTPTQV
jgi:ketose-bisphosphate aldolase